MRLMLSLIILSLILVACGTGDPTATPSVFSDPLPDASDLTATPNDFEERELATEEVGVLVTPQTNVEQGQAPLPGTLAFDDSEDDENFNEPFDRVIFRRHGGGPTAVAFRLELYQDGSYEINNEFTGQVDPSVITNVDTLIKELRFFSINTPMLGPGGDDTNYRYDITVERAGDELTINAEDGFIPQPFQRLIATLVSIYIGIADTIGLE